MTTGAGRHLVSFPSGSPDRDRFVMERRSPRPSHDPWRYQNLIVENERAADGRPARVATVFLTGRECPWRCVMCDLWRGTIASDTPPGAIPRQIETARDELARRYERVTTMKLYNAASFFDPRAVPESDYSAVASHLVGLERVIVECHPALIDPRVDRFLDALERHKTTGLAPVHLEVAMGLETAHPEALERLHKHMTVEEFAAAANRLKDRGVSLRVFLLISPPFVPFIDQDDSLLASIDVAFSCGASVVSLIPTRTGNGALEALEDDLLFRPPTLEDIERSFAAALQRSKTPSHGLRRDDERLFVDLWDLERFATCPHCVAPRRARLKTMNLEQQILPEISCRHCMNLQG
jgi:radical SAM enzyme (TIGR01210 family)